MEKRKRYICKSWQAIAVLEDSCRSKHMKIWSSRSEFEQCSSFCVGKSELCFFRSNAMNA